MIAAGDSHSMALTHRTGQGFTWGNGLRRPLLRLRPLCKRVLGPLHLSHRHTSSSIDERDNQNCACVARASEFSAGDYGKLGHGDTTSQYAPQQLLYFANTKLAW